MVACQKLYDVTQFRELSEEESPEGEAEEFEILAPYFAQESYAYPLPLLATFLVMIALILFCLEAFCLRTTLFSKKARRLLQDMQDAVQSGVDSLINFVDSDDDVDDKKAGDTSPARAPLPEWGKAECADFWSHVAAESAKPCEVEAEADCGSDIVGFARLKWAAYEAQGKVAISVVRSGPCTEPLEIKLRTVEISRKSSFKAIAGEEFEKCDDIRLSFAPGTKVQSFDVRIFQDSGKWHPTRIFSVRLDSVTSGKAVLGGPSTFKGKHHGGREARVFILQAEGFPDCISQQKFADTSWGALTLVWRYFLERKKARGTKFWKTMFAMLYDPFQSIVVATVAQKVLLDIACVPNNSPINNYWVIAMVALALLVSLALLRWANVVQTRNRGRTGGCRMEHRIDILSKLLGVDYEELIHVPPATWLYTALVDVDNIVASGYWQGFIMCQNIFALILSMLVLILSQVYSAMRRDANEPFDIGSLITIIGMLLMVPISLVLIWRREAQTAANLWKRQAYEQQWVAALAHLTGQTKMLHAVGVKDSTALEAEFEAESKEFVKHHQAARDLLNDNTWVTTWTANIFYIFVVISQGQRLLNSNIAGSTVVQAGDLVLVLKVYSSFGKYLVKVNQTIVSMMKAAVSLRRVANLMDLKEHSSLVGQEVDPQVSLDPRAGRQIVFTNVAKDLPAQGIRFRMCKDARVAIPLGNVVYLRFGNLSEGAQQAFMHLLAGIEKPSEGQVVSQSAGSMIMLPLHSFQVRHMSVLERLMFTGLNAELARRAAQALGFEPDRRCTSMLNGEHKVLELFVALLRDPEVLVLDRPFLLMPGAVRHNMMGLLRLWQSHGGATAIIHQLNGGEQGSDTSKLHPLLRQRTLVTTDSDWEAQSHDVLLDISSFFEEKELGDQMQRKTTSVDFLMSAQL